MSGKNVEMTLAIIKPDSYKDGHSGKIIDMIIKDGFDILGIKLLSLTKDEAGIFYEVHSEKFFYDELCNFLSSGKVIVLALERENAITRWRELMGATDPEKAAEGTIRKLYGTAVDHNAAHGSDSLKHGKDEVYFFFNSNELLR